MHKRIVKSGNKTYIVTVPSWDSGGGGGVLAGSIDFGANANQYLSINGGTDFVLGTGSFTVEWFHYHKSLTSFTRIYTQGVWNTAENAVSIEGTTANGTGYLWLDGLGNTPAVANSFTVVAPRLNQWDHFAVTRESGSNIQIFRNGTRLGFITRAGTPAYIDANISSSVPLFIGSEGDGVVGSRFSGSITNFRIVKGYALYSESYSRPTSPLTSVPGTVLLLLAENESSKYVDSSGLSKTVTGNSVSWSVNSPFI
jgi:hypothetical protein